MKFEDWTELSDEEKITAIERELKLITHNGISKEELVEMIRFAWNMKGVCPNCGVSKESEASNEQVDSNKNN